MNSLDGIGLRPVAGSMEAHFVRWDTEDGVVLDILARRRQEGEPSVLHHGSGAWAQARPFLKFSLQDLIDAVVLGREGVLVRVRTLEPNTVHKLIVASARDSSHRASPRRT